jgi:MFS family permease
MPNPDAAAQEAVPQASPADIERQGWRIVRSLFVIELIIWGSTFHTFGVFFIPLTKQFGLSFTRVSVLATVLSLTTGLMSPLVGWVLDHIDVRKVMATGITLIGVSFITASRANSFSVLMIAYLILGIGLACSHTVPASATVANWFGERRGTALGVVISGMALGGLLVPPLAQKIVLMMGWRACYLILGVFMVVTLIPAVLLLVRARPAGALPASFKRKEGTPDIPGYDIRSAFRTRALWSLLIFFFIEGFAVNLSHAHLIPFLIVKGYAPERATLLFSFVQGVAFIGCILLGGLGDRIGGRKALALAMTLTALGLLMLLGADRPIFVGIFIVLYGSSTAGISALLALLVAESLGLKHFGFFLGLGNFAVTTGLAVAPPVAGRIFDVTKSYSSAFELGAVIAIIGAIIILSVPAPRFKGLTSLNPERSAA